MRLFEVNQLNWAVGTNITHASNLSKSDQTDPKNTILWVNIKDLMHSTDPFQKVDLDNIEIDKNILSNRVPKAINHFQSGSYMDPSFIHYNEYGNNIVFTDGRHRLIAAFLMGEQYAPVIVNKDDIDKIKELVDTK